MKKFQSKLVCGNSITVVIDNTPYSVDSSHACWLKLRQAIKDDNADMFLDNYSIESAIEKYQSSDDEDKQTSNITIKDEKIYYKGKEIHDSICDLILRNMREGFNVAPLVKFLEKVYSQCSFNARTHLFNFLTKHRLSITEDGDFLAYKCVQENYLDKYSGTYSNHVGAVMEMSRSEVDDNPNNHCSNGFHVGGLAYSGPGGFYHSAGDKVVIVSVNPADVVSVPTDHNFLKLRTCKYTVVGEYKTELQGAVYSGKVGDVYDEFAYDDDYEENYCVEEPEDMLNGHTYTFYYTKHDGTTSRRYVMVTSKNYDKEFIVAELIAPEENEGEVRSFKFDCMSDIEEYDVE